MSLNLCKNKATCGLPFEPANTKQKYCKRPKCIADRIHQYSVVHRAVVKQVGQIYTCNVIGCNNTFVLQAPNQAQVRCISCQQRHIGDSITKYKRLGSTQLCQIPMCENTYIQDSRPRRYCDECQASSERRLFLSFRDAKKPRPSDIKCPDCNNVRPLNRWGTCDECWARRVDETAEGCEYA